MPLIDLTAATLDIRFDKGMTLDPILWYINPDFTAIDLTGYSAVGEVTAEMDSATVIWALSTGNGNLTFAAATVLDPAHITDLAGVVHSLSDAQGIQFNISAALTDAVLWDVAYYEIRLLAPDGTVKPFAKGRLLASTGLC